MIDGDPVRSCNIAGYINSTKFPKRLKGEIPTLEPNVEWVYVEGPIVQPTLESPHPSLLNHIVTITI